RDKPAFVLRPQSPGKAPRNAVALDDGRILYSAGDLYVADATGVADVVAATTASVAFIAVQSDEVLVAYDNGTVARFGRQNLEPRGSARCCGEITAGATLPWLGTTRLLLASVDGPVHCVGLDDALMTQYVSAHRGIRALTATGDLIAGLSADRQRIVVWKSWDGRQPAGEIHIGGIARHRAADLCFA